KKGRDLRVLRVLCGGELIPSKIPSRRKGLRRERDVEAEPFEALDEFAFEPRGIERVEIVGAEVAIGAAIADDAKRDREDRMGDRNGGALHATARREPTKQGGQIRVAFRRHRPRALTQVAAEPRAAFAN